MFLLSQEGGERLALVFLDIIEHRRHKVGEQVESWRMEKMEMLLLVICHVFLYPFLACITSLHICYVCFIYNLLYTYDTCDISTCIFKYDHSHTHVYNCMHTVFKVMTWICRILISTCICMDTRTRTHTHTLDQCSMFVVSNYRLSPTHFYMLTCILIVHSSFEESFCLCVWQLFQVRSVLLHC